MLSFQARKKDNNYLVPVMNWMSGQNASKPSQSTQNITNYATSKPAQYIQSKPAGQGLPPSPYKPYAQTQELMRQSSQPGYQKPVVKPYTESPGPGPEKTTAPIAQQQQYNPMSRYQELAAGRQDYLKQQSNEAINRQKQIYDVRNNALQSQIPQLQGQLDKYIQGAGAGIAEQERLTQLAKEGITQRSGEEMKLNAQTAREGRGRLQGTLAGLNALDSSSTGQLMAKAEGNLANTQAGALRAREQGIAQADHDLVTYKRDAENAKQTEIGKFNNALRDLQANMDVNSLEYQNAASKLLNDAQTAIYGIETGVAQKEMETQQMYDKMDAELQMEQMKGTNGKLSDKQTQAQTALQQIQQVRDWMVKSPNINKFTKLPWTGKDYDTVITSLTDMIGRMRSGGACLTTFH